MKKVDNVTGVMETAEKMLFVYQEAKAKSDASNANFDKIKKSAYLVFDELFESVENDVKSIGFVYDDTAVTLTQVTPTKVEFDADKLSSMVGKEIYDKVVKVSCTINDFDRFAKFMRKKGIKFSEVKDMLSIHKSVDPKELDKLEAIGLISLNDIAGSYTVTRRKPYYLTKESAVSEDEEPK